MTERSLSHEVSTAIYELQRYLCDEMAPMMVSDAITVLMTQRIEVVAPQIHGWVNAQYARGDAKYSVSDYFYHALKKLHIVSEFKLIEPEQLRAWLQALTEHLLPYCPEDEREKLVAQIGHLGEAEAVLTAAPVEKIYHAAGGGAKPAGGPRGATGAAGAPARGGAANV